MIWSATYGPATLEVFSLKWLRLPSFVQGCNRLHACFKQESNGVYFVNTDSIIKHCCFIKKTIKINHYIVVQIFINLNIVLLNLSEDDPLTSEAINDGMKQWSSNTCITFKERTTETAFIYFFIGGRHVTSINFDSAHNTRVD